jgi:hypothetical protein
MRKLTVGFAVSLIIAGCGGGGGSPSSDNKVSAQSAPTTTVQISSSTKDVLRGDNVTISWSSNNATSCNASGDWNGNKSTSGTESVAITKDSNTFTITCNGISGSVSVNSMLYQIEVIKSSLPEYAIA